MCGVAVLLMACGHLSIGHGERDVGAANGHTDPVTCDSAKHPENDLAPALAVAHTHIVNYMALPFYVDRILYFSIFSIIWFTGKR